MASCPWRRCSRLQSLTRAFSLTIVLTIHHNPVSWRTSMTDSLRRLAAAPLCLTALLLLSCSNQPTMQSQPAAPPDTRAADESTIRGLDADWTKAAAAKDAAKTASFYADNGSLFAPGAPAATGREAVQKTWEALMAMPGYALNFGPTKIEVARNRDFAYPLRT